MGGGGVAERRGQRFKFECVRAEQAGLDSILVTAAVAKQAVVDGGRCSSGSCLDTDAAIILGRERCIVAGMNGVVQVDV